MDTPQVISGTVQVQTASGLQPVQGVTISNCPSPSGTWPLTAPVTTAADRSFHFDVAINTGYCVTASGFPANDTNLQINPSPGGYSCHPQGSGPYSSYEWQWAGNSLPTPGTDPYDYNGGNYQACNRYTESGFNFVLTQYALLVCTGFSATTPTNVAVPFTVSYTDYQ